MKIEFLDGTKCEAEIHWYGSSWDWRERIQNQADCRVTLRLGRRGLCFACATGIILRRWNCALKDEQASRHRQVRVIDESGEDYLYPEEYFVPIKLPQAAERAVLKAI
jgi:hypothetical protein